MKELNMRRSFLSVAMALLLLSHDSSKTVQALNRQNIQDLQFFMLAKNNKRDESLSPEAETLVQLNSDTQDENDVAAVDDIMKKYD